MRGKVVLGVFCCWPLLNFLNHNKTQLGHGEYVVVASVFALTLGIALTLYGLCQWVWGPAKYPNTVAALVAVLLLFFNYHILYPGIDTAMAWLGWQHGSNAVYLGLLLTLPLVAWGTCTHPGVLDALLVAGLAALLLPTLTLSYYGLTKMPFHAAHATHATYASPVTPLPRSPNIYYLMTDSYPRQDQLRTRFQYDNTPFLDYLTAQGFYVAAQAYANYPLTFLSLSSVLWMDYPVTDASPPFVDRHRFYAIIQGHNPVVTALKAHGYAYLHMGSGRWAGSQCGGTEDRCLANNDELYIALSSMTPLAAFQRTYAITTAASLEHQLEALTPSQPFFLLAHLHTPHPPRTFDQHCQPRLGKPTGPFWNPASKPAYLNDVRCTNAQLIRVLDTIVARDPQAVIILHSDHGPAYSVNWQGRIDHWSRDAFEERFAILMALRLPAECRHTLYGSLSPVNIFRVTLACLEGRPPETLADVSYIAPYEDNEQAGQVHQYVR